ncbi:energy-coupling factor transporter transmembrane component T family protein [Sulfurospirillum arcachonense]|uniref:energy-coupling factor transporter transmembrane component T family protein n=1 Tax=Sulfurospirillum arcachonense TaxID=57666 RepID=UPI0004681470|nr:energy-coupling factor transporter transmembrane component T [Sulfurospirillum arcachonense]
MISASFGLITTTIYSFGLSFFDTIYISMFLPSLLLMLLQRKAIFETLKRLLLLNVFIVMVSASALLNQDYELALLVFLRSNALLLFTLLIFWNKSIFDIAISLQTLRVPNKLSSLFFFVAKFITIIKEEFEITKKVMKIRNFQAKSNVFSYKIYANVIGMMIVKCFDKADKLKNTMLLRNFQGKVYQSKVDKFTRIDFIIFIFVIISLSLHVGEIKL